jgi:hypothetical protein
VGTASLNIDSLGHQRTKCSILAGPWARTCIGRVGPTARPGLKERAVEPKIDLGHDKGRSGSPRAIASLKRGKRK